MAKIKIHINPPKVSKETIERHKDYGRFIRGYKRFHSWYTMRSLYRNKRMMHILLLIIMVVLVLFFWS